MYLEGYFGYRPLLPGETVVLSVHLNNDQTELLGKTSVQAYGGLTVDTLPIRIPSKNEISWRIRANDFGKHTLRVKINGQRTDKIVVITDKLKNVLPRKATNNLWNIIVNPWESPIPKHLPIEKIVVHYPVRNISMIGIEMNWLVSFVILTIVFGYVFKGLLRVEI